MSIRRYLLGLVCILLFGGTAVIYTIQASRQIHPISQQVIFDFSGLVGILVLSGILGLLIISRKIVSPLTQLVVDAEDAIEFGRAIEIQEGGPEEVRRLRWSISRLATDLESQVEARTLELNQQTILLQEQMLARQRTEESLELAKAAAEAADQAKSQFLSIVSHELRTPLNAISGAAVLLQRTGMSEEQKRLAQIASEAGNSLTILLNDILDMSCLEAGNLELSSGPVDLVEMLETTVDQYHEAARDKQLLLSASVDPDLPASVMADQARFSQLIRNLLANALKYTDKGLIHVSLKLDQQPGQREMLYCSVTDSGRGISEGNQASLFSSFTRLDGSMTREKGGAGLGLALSRRLVGMMGGQIGLKSKLGRGSEVWFTIPLVRNRDAREDGLGELKHHLSQLGVLLLGTADESQHAVAKVLEGWPAQLKLAKFPGTDEQLENLPSADVVVICSPALGNWSSQRIRKICQNFKSATRLVVVSADEESSTPTDQEQGFFDTIHVDSLLPSRLLEAVSGVRLESWSRHKWAHAAGNRILLVDDSESNLFVASAILEQAGYEVSKTDNGERALEFLAANPIDLVLMDLQMPVMDGFEATARIRQLPDPIRQVPVVALSANVDDLLQFETRKSNFDAWLSKPFNAQELINIIEKWRHIKHSLVVSSMAS